MSSSRPRVEEEAVAPAQAQAAYATDHWRPGGYERNDYRITCAYMLDRLVKVGWFGCWYLLVLSLVSRRPLARSWCWTGPSPAAATAAAGRWASACPDVSADWSVAVISRKSPKQTMHCSAMLRRPQESCAGAQIAVFWHVFGACCGCEVGRRKRDGLLAARFKPRDPAAQPLTCQS